MGIVGMVASAGGLAPFQAFFDRVPPDTGLAFVIVPHLDPSHRSLMTQLLAGHTEMAVQEIEDGMRPRANQVYLIPPGFQLTISGGVLHLAHPDGRALDREATLDVFLRALAADQQQRAIGIVLSGTGTQGTLGLRDIKDQGGVALVQEPSTAQFDSMPRSAIAAGVADRVLSPRALADQVAAWARRASSAQFWISREPDQGAEVQQLAGVLALLRARTRYDFRFYRKNMLLRRVKRRMSLCNLDSVPEYLARLRKEPAELSELFRDLLIGVTSFFRDPQAFEVLTQRVLEPLVQEHAIGGTKADQPIRVWVPGCATGEEPYSIAMLLFETFSRHEQPPNLQVFATDIDDKALDVARYGAYPPSIAADVSEQRLRTFFVKDGEDRYRVSEQLRDAVVFAPQNLITDAPFSKLDLISCRNLLIYLEQEVQERIVSLFHFALNPGGYLLLGPSESVGSRTELYETTSKRWRLFQRSSGTRPDLSRLPPAARLQPVFPSLVTAMPRAHVDMVGVAQRVLLEEYGPAAVLVNRRYDILHLFGPTTDYMELPVGRPALELTSMLRRGLRTRVRAACHKALEAQTTVLVDDAQVQRSGRYVPVRVRVTPLHDPGQTETLLLLSFVDVETAAAGTAIAPVDLGELGRVPDSSQAAALIEQLENELRATREDLQTTVEEMESANEELKASNEEAMSMNEELQSANEELEVSKEELQSLNEELSTVNSQLEDKVHELEQSNNDISNLLSSTEIATVFLDAEMQVKRFTPRAARLLNLRLIDIGRPLGDLTSNVSDEELLPDARLVLERLAPMERDVVANDHSRYLRRIQPYRTQDNRIAGVVLTFVDITARAKAEQALRASEARFRLLFERSPMCLLEQDWSQVRDCLLSRSGESGAALADWVCAHPEQALACRDKLRVSAANASARQLAGVSDPSVVDVPMAEQFFPLEPGEGYLALLGELLMGRAAAFELEVHTGSGGRIPVLAHAVPLPGHFEHLDRVLMAVIDITARKRIELALADRERRLSAVLDTVVDGLIGVNADGRISQVNQAAERLFGRSHEALIGEPLASVLLPGPAGQHLDDIMQVVREAAHADAQEPSLCDGVCEDGSLFPAELSVGQVDHLDLFVILVRDVSRRRELEKQVIEISTREQERIGREIHDSLGQQLTAVTLLAAALAGKLETAGSREGVEARTLAEQLERTLSESRALTQGLAPVGVSPEDLADALSTLARQVQHSSGIKCRLHCEGAEAIEDAVVASHVYRIAQEAINNAARHGKPKRIDVRLEVPDRKILLSVRDDGTWSGARKRGSGGLGGLGLHIMGYRAGILGGRLSVRPLDTGGTLMRCEIPLPDARKHKSD
ncbi:MAG: PAS domain S-box protein [Chromatiaceae bacterium]|nr:PAS domain S-box protein [Chromatiaceae bacterium]